MRYEYDGYIGNEQWAIISELTEKEILEKYRPIVSDYIPFIVLTPAFGEVRDEYRRNEKKFQMRAARKHDFYNFEDSEIELYHAELVTDDLEKNFFKSEEEQVLRKAIQGTRTGGLFDASRKSGFFIFETALFPKYSKSTACR